jgi:hypothetical protein
MSDNVLYGWQLLASEEQGGVGWAVCGELPTWLSRYPSLPVIFSEVMDVHGRLRAVVANSPYRLHQVRGHYKTYTQEAPLFGKITGRFFWSEQFRGQQSEGVIKHRYEINQLPSRQS